MLDGADIGRAAGDLWPLALLGVVSIPLGLAVFGAGERYAKRRGKLKRSGERPTIEPAAVDRRHGASHTEPYGSVSSRSMPRCPRSPIPPGGRAVLERLGQGRRRSPSGPGRSGSSLTGMKKRVRVLEEAGLVRQGRPRPAAGASCALGPQRLDDVERFVDAYRRMLDGQLDRLGGVLKTTEGRDER